jgi:hypothetical protein
VLGPAEETTDAHLEEKVYILAAKDARWRFGQGMLASSRMLTLRHHAHCTSLACLGCCTRGRGDGQAGSPEIEGRDARVFGTTMSAARLLHSDRRCTYGLDCSIERIGDWPGMRTLGEGEPRAPVPSAQHHKRRTGTHDDMARD